VTAKNKAIVPPTSRPQNRKYITHRKIARVVPDISSLTDRHTDVLIAILGTRSRGRSNNVKILSYTTAFARNALIFLYSTISTFTFYFKSIVYI